MKRLFMAIMACFAGGASCSQGADYTTQDNAAFALTIAQEGTQLIDVRTPSEYKSGYITGAVNIDVNAADFESLAAKLDPSRPVAVYCRSGMRSRKAAQWFASKGYTVYNLRSGVMGWSSPLSH